MSEFKWHKVNDMVYASEHGWIYYCRGDWVMTDNLTLMVAYGDDPVALMEEDHKITLHPWEVLRAFRGLADRNLAEALLYEPPEPTIDWKTNGKGVRMRKKKARGTAREGGKEGMLARRSLRLCGNMGSTPLGARIEV